MANDQVDVAEQEAADAAAFESGFEDPAIETPTATPEVQQQEATPVASEAAADAPKFVQITEEQFQNLQSRAALIDEIKAAQEKQFGTAFGKIGGIERILNQVPEQLKPGDGAPVQISEEDFSTLRQEYPDLAASLVHDLGAVLSKARGAGSVQQFDQAALDQLVNDRLGPALQNAETKIEQKLEVKALNRTHPDWQQSCNSDEFKSWIATQPDNLAAQFYDSWDSHFIGNTLTKFQSAQKAAADAVAPKQNQQPSARTRQLAAAVTPKGTGGHATGPTEEDEFQAGFASC